MPAGIAGTSSGTAGMYGGVESDTEEESEITLPEWLHSIDELDTYQGLLRFGSAEIYLDTLKIYADSAPASADEIENLWRAGDLQNTTIKVHAIKSLSRTIGADAIGALAEKLEYAGKAGEKDVLEAEIDDLLSRVRTLCDDLSPLLDKKKPQAVEDDSLPRISDEELREAFEELRGFAADMDEESAEFVFDFLSGFSLTPDIRERLNKIKGAIEGFDWDQATELLNQEDIFNG